MRMEDREEIRAGFLGKEDGNIYFFYRPKALEAHSSEDVAEIYLILHPFDLKVYRLIALNSSKLPEEGDEYNLISGRVGKVNSKPQVIMKELEARTEMIWGVPRVKQSAARPCGEGVYTLIEKNRQTHLVYVLELPNLDGKLKGALRINEKGSFTVGVYNPYYEYLAEPFETYPSGPALSESLKAKLDGERLVTDSVEELLNYETINIALFRESLLDLEFMEKDLRPFRKTEATADIFADLKIQKEHFPCEPLLKGEWR